MVPYVMMDCLEVPFVGARLNIDGNDGVSKQICALPVPSIKATNWRSQGQKEESPLLVECEIEGPDIDTQSSLPAVTFPGVVANGTRLRDRAEFPELRSGARVESPRIPDSSDRSWRRVGADHDNISVNARHRVVRDAKI